MVVLAAVVSATLGLAAGAGASTARIAGNCPAVLLVGARGSGESANSHQGVGAEVDTMATALQGALAAGGVSMQVLADTYPADSVDGLKPSRKERLLFLVHPGRAALMYLENNVVKYFRSIHKGVQIAVRDVKETMSACPNTGIVLAGYSQGAMVIHRAELQLAKTSALYRVVGTLLLADGDRVPHTAAAESLGTVPAGSKGILPYLSKAGSRDVPLPASTADICNAGDIVCDFNANHVLSPVAHEKVHTSYVGSPFLTQAAEWLAKLIAPPTITFTTAALPAVAACVPFSIPVYARAAGRFSAGPGYFAFNWAFGWPQTSPAISNKVTVFTSAVGVTLAGSDIPPGTYNLDLVLSGAPAALTLPAVLAKDVSAERNYTITVTATPEEEKGC